jgi:hypothetical protein
MSLRDLTLVAVSTTFGLVGCGPVPSTIYAVSRGSHDPNLLSGAHPTKPLRVQIRTANPVARAVVMSELEHTGVVIVDSEARTSTAASKVDRVVVAEVDVKPVEWSEGYANRYRAAASSGVSFHVAVAVRMLIAETGEVRWSGQAMYPEPISKLDEGIEALTHIAMRHAACPIERGATWVEQRYGTWGCLPPNSP